VHFEISRRQGDRVPELAWRALREREGYAVELLAVLYVRDPDFHDLPMRGSELEFHIYLTGNVGEDRESNHSGSEHCNEPRQALAMGLEEGACGTHDSFTIPVQVRSGRELAAVPSPRC
jgi:hypothetical protein